MSYDARFVEDRLRVAEQQELEVGDANLFADLRACLSPEVVADGVHINFADNRDAIDSVITLLDIPRALWARTGQLHVHNVVVESGATTSFIGEAIMSLANLRILDALDALQADHWRWDTPHGPYPKIRLVHAEVVTSKFILGRPIEVDGHAHTDHTAPGIVIGVINRYLPDFKPHRSKLDLNYFFRDIDPDRKFPRNVVGPLTAEMVVHNLALEMPHREYFMRIGALKGTDIHPALDSVVDVFTRHKFTLDAGRVTQG